ncbi:MAG TPA: arylesterase [Burkholderiales bacterium]|nr:arylesterase [Burkholderiales bacterium]
MACRRGFAALWLVLLCVGCGRDAPALARLGPDDVVLAFGDSLTFGTGVADDETYPAVLAGLIGRKVVRDGVPGETTAQGLERLEASLETHRPRLLLLCLGGNDLLRRVDAAQIESNLRAMVQLARSRGAEVVLIGVPEPALFGGTAPLYRRLAAELRVLLEEETVTDVLRDEALKSDPIHPNAEGYRRIAQALAALLRDAGAIH